MSWWLLLGPLLLLIALALGLRRANELFLLSLRAGRLTLRRGRIPPRLLADLADVVQASKGAELELRGVVRQGRAALEIHRGSLPAPLRQRLRNVISLWPVAKIRNAPRRR